MRERVLDLAAGSDIRGETWLVCPEGLADNTLTSEQMMLRASLVKAHDGWVADIARLVHGRDAALVSLIGVAARLLGLADARDPCLRQRQLMGLANRSEDMHDLWYNCLVGRTKHLTARKQQISVINKSLAYTTP
jgi:hypothetical protein